MYDLEDDPVATDQSLESDTDVPSGETVEVDVPTERVVEEVREVIDFDAEREEILNKIGFGD